MIDSEMIDIVIIFILHDCKIEKVDKRMGLLYRKIIMANENQQLFFSSIQNNKIGSKNWRSNKLGLSFYESMEIRDFVAEGLLKFKIKI